MRKLIILLISSLATLNMLHANGDPTDRISALIASGNPAPLTITDIQLISEHLWIRPGLYTEVKVRYVVT